MASAATRDSARAEWTAHWPVPLVSALGIAVSVSALYSLGALMAPIQADTGWSRSTISAGPTFLTVAAIVLGPAIGALIDRVGSRGIALLGLALYCAALAGLALVGRRAAGWYAGWALLAIGYVAAKPTVWSAAVVGRFSASRGLALGVALSGTGIGSALSPVTATLLQEAVGWRATYAWLAAGGAAVTLPLTWLFFRDAPRIATAAAPGATRWRLVRSPKLALMGAACLLSALPSGALLVHFVPIAKQAGLAAHAAAYVAGFVGVFTVAGRLAAGALLDRIGGGPIGAASCLSALAACPLLLLAHGAVPAAVAASLLGLSAGSEYGVLAFLIPRFFGSRHFAFLFSLVSAVFTLAVGAGPLLAGLIFDRTGGYGAVLVAAAPAYVLAALCFGLLGRPPAADATITGDAE